MSDAHIQEVLHDHEKQHHNGRAQPLRVTEVHPLRLIFWTVVIVLISVAAMAWVSSMKGETFPKELSAFALGVAIIPFLASPIEWFVHRFVYHQPAIHANQHRYLLGQRGYSTHSFHLVHGIVEAQPWFTFLDNHHYIHHVSLGANLNFLLPMADLLFGTLRTQLTPEELRAHGSLKRAKMIRVGEGEPVHTTN